MVHGTDLVGAGIASAITVVDVNGMVLEPAGEDMCLRPTGVRIMPTSKAPGPRPELIQRQRSELIRKMQIKPQHFVGRDVFKHFNSDDCVWHGRVLETFKNKHLPENCWVVR